MYAIRSYYVQLPLLFFGLGAQARDYEQTEFDFHPSIQRLVDLIRERSPLPWLHIAEEVAAVAAERGFRKLLVLRNNFV